LQDLLRVKYNWDKIPFIQLPLNWDEIREMKKSGLVAIGSHTVTHPILSRCTYEEQRAELTLSRNRVIEELNEECVLFCYPNGEVNDYNHWTIKLLKELGYVGALTTINGYVDINNRDNFQLNRWGYAKTAEDQAILISGLYRLFKK